MPLVVIPLLALALSGCWTSARANIQNTANQPLDGGITVGNAHQLHRVWNSVADATSGKAPVATDGRTAFVHGYGSLDAFDAAGFTSCSSDAPRQCQPEWRGLTDSTAGAKSAVIGGDLVYVAGGFSADTHGHLQAFDVNGSIGCSGVPKLCTPVWQATLPDELQQNSVPSPVVAGNLVYVAGVGGVRAYDAAGQANCTGSSPRTCAPLWTTANEGTPSAVDGGRLYVVTADGIDVYAADGSTGCSGVPLVCSPLYNLNTNGAADLFTGVAVSDGKVLGVENGDGSLDAWDAAGTANCSGSPKVCLPVWTSADRMSGLPAVAGGLVYAVTGLAGATSLEAFDVNGCTGSPAVCAPQWRGPAGPSDGPSVVGKVVTVASSDGGLYVFDAAGFTDCIGTTTPRACEPLARVVVGGFLSSASISTGGVYVVAPGIVSAWRVD